MINNTVAPNPDYNEHNHIETGKIIPDQNYLALHCNHDHAENTT